MSKRYLNFLVSVALVAFLALSFYSNPFESVPSASSVFVSAAKGSKKTEDPKACEVCIKVLEDVESKFLAEKKDKKDKDKIEKALGKYCKNKELGPKEKKICYYLDPIKKYAITWIR